jgi:signal transduction histidine kinase
MDTRIREKDIAVEKVCAKRLPQILVDHEKIEQVMINVLLNAVEILPKGGNIEIVTKRSRMDRRALHGRTLQVEISDDGPGISVEDLPYIFNPFFSNKKKGTGLGLFNVKKIIEAHGGTGSVALRKPHGTRVSLTIPFREKT